MDDGLPLTLTLTLEGVAEGNAEERRAADAFIAGLVTDPRGIEGVAASAPAGDNAEPGGKGLGPLLGVLTAEVNGRNALKVVRHLRSRLLDRSRPIRLKLSRKGGDGAELAVELEGSAKDQEAIDALLTRLEACVRRLS